MEISIGAFAVVLFACILWGAVLTYWTWPDIVKAWKEWMK